MRHHKPNGIIDLREDDQEVSTLLKEPRITRKSFVGSFRMPQFSRMKLRLFFAERPLLFLQSGILFFVVIIVLSATHLGGIAKKVYAFEERTTQLQPQIAKFISDRRFLALIPLIQEMEVRMKDLRADVPRVLALPHQTSLLASGSSLLDAGSELALAAKELARIAQSFSNLVADAKVLSVDEMQERYKRLTSFLEYQWKDYMQSVYPHLQKGSKYLALVDSEELPSDMMGSVETVRTMLHEAVMVSDKINEVLPELMIFLGQDEPKRYAVLLQSSGEMRATGGFIGSLAMIKLNDGWLEEMEFLDIYHLDGQMTNEVPAPTGLQRVTPLLSLRDANYWPDMVVSSREVLWFLDQVGYPTVDGVIAINDGVISELLGVIGEVEVPEYGVTFNKDLFAMQMSLLVESKLSKGSPKEVLFAFADKVIAQIIGELERTPELLSLFSDQVQRQQILAYSKDHTVEKQLIAQGLAGRMYYAEPDQHSMQDYLMVTHLNNGGNKADRYLLAEVDHITSVTDDYRIRDEVSITHHHLFTDETESQIREMAERVGIRMSQELLRILGKDDLQHYMRVYVPKGSRLLEAQGVEYSDVEVLQEFDRTVFAFQMNTKRSETANVTLRYELPEPFVEHNGKAIYQFAMQRQPGGHELLTTQTFASSRAFQPLQMSYNGVVQQQDVAYFAPLQQVLMNVDEYEFQVDLK